MFEVDVLSDVCFGPKNQGLSKEECEKQAREALELVGFPEKYYKQSPFELSGGQKRRVAIAGILAMHPKVLVLDEPTAGLDPKGRDEILDQVKLLHEKTGMTRNHQLFPFGLCGLRMCRSTGNNYGKFAGLFRQ